MNKIKEIIKLIYFITKFRNDYVIYEYVKKIYYDFDNYTANIELLIKNICDSTNYIFNNINQSFTKELLIKAYFLLSNKLIDSAVVNKLIELYYKNIDVAPHSLAALLHLFIINNVEKNNLEFAFLISNYIMLKKGRWFLMPYEYCHNDYREAVKNNDLSSLIRIFYDIESVKKDKKPCLLSKDEVIQKIKYLKEELVTKYYIEKLYLFGSFAKGNNTEKSDLDFVVILNESLINNEKNEIITNVKNT
ncbi:MAG: nucleotidyltransferase domain-containing protein [Bacilli bacterium]